MGEERTNQEWIEDNNDKIDEIKAKVNNLPDDSNLKDLMTVTGTGENVILEDTAEELDYVVPPLPRGNIKQNTTEGYQLIELADFTSFTNNGITFTKLDDGGIKVNGTSTSQAYINLLTGNTSVSNNPRNITLEADEYYTLSGSSSNLELMLHTSSYSNVHQATGSNATFKESTDTNISTVRINANSGTTINNEIIYPMLEKGSTAHDFEKYTNGVSPNSSYPQEVQVVKGDVEVKIENENFLPNRGATQTINNVSYTVNDDKSVFAKGTADSNNSDFYLVGDKNNYIDLGLKEGAYNFGGCIDGTGQTYMLFMVKKDINDSITYHQSTTTNGLVVNISKGDTFRIFIRVLAGISVNAIFYPQLVFGSTLTPYTPHKEQKLPLYLPVENLANMEYFKENYTLDSNGLPVASSNRITNTTPINVKSFDNVVVSFKNNTSDTINFIYSILDANNNLISRVAGNSSGASINTSTAEYLYICFYDNVTLQSISEIQIEPGSKAHHYTPFGASIELCKMGDNQDFPFKAINGDSYYDSLTTGEKNSLEYGEWYWHKEINKDVSDGNIDEDWQINPGYNNVFFKTKPSDLVANETRMMCNMTTYFGSNYYTTQDYVIAIGGSLNFKNTDVNTVEDLRTFLAVNNLILYYVSEEPTNIKITDTVLINQLEAIYHDTMSYAKTYINGSSEGLDPLFDVRAYRNTKSIWEDIWG